MRCARCTENITDAAAPCPHCGFQGDPLLIQELDHVRWLLGEIVQWTLLSPETRNRIRRHYEAREREMEQALGLRLPPFTDDEARTAWPVLLHREGLQMRLKNWAAAGLLKPEAGKALAQENDQAIKVLAQRLEGRLRPAYPTHNEQRLALTRFLVTSTEPLVEQGAFVSDQAQAQALQPLMAEQERLMIALHRRAAPARPAPAQPAAAKPPVSDGAGTPAPAGPPPVAGSPPLPLGDRLWRTLLSERTLQAMLVLGAFLIFAGAISGVIWGWKDFSSPVRITIPLLFTAIFLALGWYVRTHTRMYRSGIALSAIAALLIPVNSYNIYINLNLAPQSGPNFWLGTSLVCVAAYLALTLIIRNAFFGYLVGTAIGSTGLAILQVAHQQTGLSLDWQPAAASIAAAGLAAASLALAHPRAQSGRLAILGRPFQDLALLASGAVMLLSLGWRYTGHGSLDTFHDAMALSWWLGGFILASGAVRNRSRSLGLLAATTFPIAAYMTQAAFFEQHSVNSAWHALGWAALVPVYLVAARWLSSRKSDPVLVELGRTAATASVVLMGLAALWSLTDLKSSSAAAASHTLLATCSLLAARLWRRPQYLYGMSLFSLTACAFGVTQLNLQLAEVSLGWISLAIAHILAALLMGNRAAGQETGKTELDRVARTLATAGLIIAAIAMLPTLFPYDGHLLQYTLGNWIALAAWAARLAHEGRPGFALPAGVRLNALRRTALQWAAVLPLPVWVIVFYQNRGPLGDSLAIALAGLAWALAALSIRLDHVEHSYRWPWYASGLWTSVGAVVAALLVAKGQLTLPGCLLAAGLLYLADALINRQSREMALGGLVTAWGLGLLLDRLRLAPGAVSFGLALLAASYFLGGLWAERRRSRTYTAAFLQPLYLAGHVVTLALLARIYIEPWNALMGSTQWTDEMRLWGAAIQIVLGGLYALFAWGRYQERWAYLAAVLAGAGGGFIAILYSSGRGTMAARAALVAFAFILTERLLHWLRHRRGKHGRAQAVLRLAWRLFSRPLLVIGWLASAGAIGMALVRNLILLEGRTPQIWAAVGLGLIVALYALSARLFRQARFVWLAALLVFIPWTIMTHLGWLVSARPTTQGFAISWMVLAWLLYLVGLVVARRASWSYSQPLEVVAHLLAPFSLVWGVAHSPTGRVTFGLAIALYGLAAVRDLRPHTAGRPVRATRFLYPALGLIPVWCVYLLARLPGARHEHYGLMLLTFGLWGLAAGRRLERLAATSEARPAFGLPAYLTGYVSAIVGVLLVAHDNGLLSLALLYAALLMVLSARVFRHPGWAYPASAFAALSLLLALSVAGVPTNRQGWGLLGLAALYLGLSWALRRARMVTTSTAPLAVGLALVALGLPPSSQDRTGALWGYSAATLLYTLTAFWLRQPLLLTPACALAIVPYAVGLRELRVEPRYWGPALLPGAVAALGLGVGLDRLQGAWHDFPWGRPADWLRAAGDRLLGWWGLPLYALGLGLASASPLFTDGQAGLAALNALLLGLALMWAIWRFRLRVWLLAASAAWQVAAALYLQDLGWWHYPVYAWVRMLPVTVVTVLAGMWIERRRKEGSPLHLGHAIHGWSRPLYALALIDLVVGQIIGLGRTDAHATITLAHTLILSGLASFWLSAGVAYASIGLSLLALVEWLLFRRQGIMWWPVPLAQLALGLGLAGYGLALARERLGERHLPGWLQVWERPLQRSGVWFSLGILALTSLHAPRLLIWSLSALAGLPFRRLVDLASVQQVIGVMALLGLLYVAVAFIRRRLRLGYLAVGMLLAAWIMYWFYVQAWDQSVHVQLYAMPAGAYLLAVSYLEAQRGNKTLARWLDYAAMLLMIGSLFWQTLLMGWRYAILLGGEGFASFWWGSARRLRRFLYAGMLGVVLATTAQIINSLREVNQWIVFGIIGLLVVMAAIIIERKLEEIKAWRQVIETWE